MSDTHLKQSVFGDLCNALAKIADAPLKSENTREMRAAAEAIENIAINLCKNLGFVGRTCASAVLSGSSRVLSELPDNPLFRSIFLNDQEWNDLLLRNDAKYIGLAFKKGLCAGDGIDKLLARGANSQSYADMLRETATIEGFFYQLIFNKRGIWRTSNAPLLAELLQICTTTHPEAVAGCLRESLNGNDLFMPISMMLAGAPLPGDKGVPKKMGLGQLLGTRMTSGHGRLALMRMAGNLTEWIADPSRQEALMTSLRNEYRSGHPAQLI